MINIAGAVPGDEAHIAGLLAELDVFYGDLPQGSPAERAAQVRDVLLGERQLPREASRISAYWKAGAADFHEAHG